MKRWISLLGLSAAAVHGALASADPSITIADPALTPGLAGYERDALARNPTLREKRLAIARANEETRAVRAGYLPQVDVNVRYTRLLFGGLDLGTLINPAYATLNQLSGEPRFPTDLKLHLPLAFDAKIELRQAVFAPGISVAAQLAELGHDASEIELAISAREITSGVRAIYLAHARAAQVAALLEQSKPLLEENLRVSQQLVATDKQTADAVYRAQAELAGHEQLILQATEARRVAARALNLLRSTPGDDPLQAPAGLPAPTAMPAPLASYLDHARRARAELRLVAVGRAVADKQRALVRTAAWPTVAVVLDYGFQRDDLSLGTNDDYASISAVASWNIFDGRKDAHRVRARTLEVEASDLERRRLLDQIETEVRNAYGAAELAIRAVAAIDARVSSAQAAYDIITKKYAAGAAPQIEVIAARTGLLQAGTDRIAAVTDYYGRLVELDRVTESTGVSR